jgi:diaminohydroxyphosphoribosylaminopyrimidine deaminase/5-amino-6-(5-phosphoribosylamino)uracil reductase
VFDTDLRTPPDARLLSAADASPVWILAGEGAEAARRSALEAAGCTVLELPRADGRLDLRAAWERLHAEGVRRILVEGGARIHGALFRAGLVDQVGVFVAPRILGGAEAVPAVEDSGFADLSEAPALEDVTWRRVGDDVLLLGYVPSS